MKTPTQKIIQECEARGITLEPCGGGNLFISPEEKTDAQLVEQIRQHKFSILATLESRRFAAALHLGRQVMQNEFQGCGPSTLKSVANELVRYSDTLCQQAIFKLHEDKNKHHAND